MALRRIATTSVTRGGVFAKGASRNGIPASSAAAASTWSGGDALAKGGDEVEVDLEILGQKVAFREGSPSSSSSEIAAGGKPPPADGAVRWGPHPATGVWVPQGQEDLHTLTPAARAEEQLKGASHLNPCWFREDVHNQHTANA